MTPTWEHCSSNSAPSFLHYKYFIISWDIILSSQACCISPILKNRAYLDSIDPTNYCPIPCNNNPLKSCLYTVSPVLLPFVLQSTHSCFLSHLFTETALSRSPMSFPVFKANHQFSDFMLFDLSIDTNWLFGIQDTYFIWFPGHHTSWFSSLFMSHFLDSSASSFFLPQMLMLETPRTQPWSAFLLPQFHSVSWVLNAIHLPTAPVPLSTAHSFLVN